AWVWTVDQLVDQEWYGGRLTPSVRARLGDIALVPFLPVAYQDPADQGDSRLVCRHGSLTAEEMMVPLLGVGGGGDLGKD
ncbi:MAG: PglZ domain-containing protein, partial [Actinomycetota bacterium]|nr:PglZ domain-containing protein [Actinomycetota bacterium]